MYDELGAHFYMVGSYGNRIGAVLGFVHVGETAANAEPCYIAADLHAAGWKNTLDIVYGVRYAVLSAQRDVRRCILITVANGVSPVTSWEAFQAIVSAAIAENPKV